MNENIVEAIIQSETNPIRFENFCRELVEASEGISLVRTSRNYDQGRDARSIGAGPATYLCATLDVSIDKKVKDDAEILAKTSVPEVIFYCYSRPLTEHKIDQLKSTLCDAFVRPPGVTFLSLTQLSPMVLGHSGIFDSYYTAELQAIEATLRRSESGDRRDDAGLRLALMTLASEDARLLREDISRNAVLEVLSKASSAIASADVGALLSKDLRLTKSIQDYVIDAALFGLQNLGYAEERGGGWAITTAGERYLGTLSSSAAKDILQGAAVVRQALEGLTGYSFTDEQFTALWSTLLDYWSSLFHANGVAVIEAVNDFISGNATSKATLQQLVTEGAAKIRNSIAISEMGEVIEQAVIDILTERSGAAFEWLSKVCERFVALCSLGLEASSTEEIHKVISRHKVMLDSDIGITVICQGERGHAATREILAKWTRLGGRLLLHKAVLEEIAYHAYVSDREFQEVKRLAPELKGIDLHRYCNNAFVRGFFTVERDPGRWATFRAMYAGDKPHDYAKVLEVLRDQMVVEYVNVEFDSGLAADIKQYLLEISSERERVESEYFGDPGRLGRDGQILATVAALREQEQRLGSDARVVLLSSSTRLRMADERFRAQLGTPEAVMSRGALSYLLSLVPESGVGIGTLRRALFDFGETAYLPDTDRFALRVIRAAATYAMPWAQRTHLRRELERNLRREAEHAGVTTKQFKIKFKAGDESTRPAHIIAQTIKEMALKDPEKVLLQTHVRKLEKQLGLAASKVAPTKSRHKKKVRTR